MRNRPIIPNAKLGPPIVASIDHAKPNTSIKVEPKTVGLRAAERWILFKMHPRGPSKDKNTGTQQASQ